MPPLINKGADVTDNASSVLVIEIFSTWKTSFVKLNCLSPKWIVLPDKYKSLHLCVLEPKSYIIFVDGTK